MYYDQETSEVLDQQQGGIQHFCEDVLRRVTWGYICWLLVATLLTIPVYSVSSNFGVRGQVTIAVFLYLFIAGIHVARRIIRGGTANILAPDILFLFVYTLFHEGYLILYVLGIVPKVELIFYFDSSIRQSLLIINLGLVGFLFGYELFGVRNPAKAVPGPMRLPTSAWGTFGFAAIVMSVVMHILPIPMVGLSAFREHGYHVVQHIDRFVGFPWSSFWNRSVHLMLFAVAIYTMYSSLRYGKLFKSNVARGLVITFAIFQVLEGNRGPLLLIAVPIVIVRHYFVKPFKIRSLVLMVVILMVLFTSMRIVRRTAFAPRKMLSELKYVHGTGETRWTDPLVEMGGSYRIANMTAYLVPDYDNYWYGRSWLSAAFHVVPFLQGFAVRQGWVKWAPSQWMTTTMFGAEAAGTGFSVAVEGYLNFGFPGAFLQLMLFGIFLRRLMIWFSRKPSPFSAFVMLACMGPTIMVIRNHVNLVTAKYAQIFVIAVILNLFLGSEPVEESYVELEEA